MAVCQTDRHDAGRPAGTARHLQDIHRLSVRKGIVVRGAGTRETVADAGYRLAHRPAVRQRNLHGLSLLRATAIFRRHADQAMISLYNTRDPYMVRNALEQGRQSIVADGITMSRYPSGIASVHFVFLALLDLHRIRLLALPRRRRVPENAVARFPRRAVVVRRIPARRSFAGLYPHWFFADWASNFDGGEPIREKEGNSAFRICCSSWGSMQWPKWNRLSASRCTGSGSVKWPMRSEERSVRNTGTKTRSVRRHVRPAQLLATRQRTGRPAGRRKRERSEKP